MSILEKIFMSVSQVIRTNKETNVSNTGKPHADFPKFLSHLEYLGYTIEESEQDDNGVFATHPQIANLWVYKRFVGIGIVAFYQMGQNAITHSSDYYKFLCEMNGESDLTIFYADKRQSSLRMNAVYPAPYEKKSFAKFMSAFYADGERVRKHSQSRFFSKDAPTEETATD